MNFSSAHSPVFANAEHTTIDLMVKFDHLDMEVSFHASGEDVEPHGRMIFMQAMAGEFGEVAPFKQEVSLVSDSVILKAELKRMLDQQAKNLEFDDFAEALTYCDEPAVPLYQQQALSLRAWRSKVWAWYDSKVVTPFTLQEALQEVPVFAML